MQHFNEQGDLDSNYKMCLVIIWKLILYVKTPNIILLMLKKIFYITSVKVSVKCWLQAWKKQVARFNQIGFPCSAGHWCAGYVQ